MASLSLPRVLQLKKNTIDAEREQFEKFQTLAVQKAINGNETPVKEKHVRSTIIGTFQDQSAATYWMVAIRQPVQDNRIVAWKFCHVTHKLLREGHPACLEDSQRHITMIGNLGKLWVHLREGYGKLVHLYCKLLICKLKFHARNPRFPGNMQVSSDELDSIAENDVNNYFQICVELFDYMDDILVLQEAVFESLGNARANSMTASGQCRLAALIPCAQDASHMYDCNVRLLFRLHAALPADTLVGHRDRFRQQFKKLSLFYKQSSNLQYYRNLLTLPVLPSNPPNFLLQSDFGTYVTPVVSIPDQPPDEPDHIGSLIDTSDTMTQASTPEQAEFIERTTPSPQPELLQERDRLIDHLQTELRRMRLDTSQMVQERNTMLTSMREHCTRLETQLQAAKCELHEEKTKVDTLSAQTPEMTQKLAMVEEKAKVQDEKFQKLKGAYTQLREEHINLIRQKAEVDKLSANLRAASAEHESSKMALQQQLNDKIKDVELLQQSTSSSEEIDAYKIEIDNLRSDLEQSRLKESQLETLRAAMETLQIDHKAALAESDDKLSTTTAEIKELQETIDRVKKEKDIELSIVKQELESLKEKSEDEYKKIVEEKEMVVEKVNLLTQQFNQEKQEQENIIELLKLDLENSVELSNSIDTSREQIDILKQEIVDIKKAHETEKRNLEDKNKDQHHEIILLQEKFKLVSDSKTEVFSNIKSLMTEKDDVMINLTVDVEKLRDEVSRYQDELEERNAELEIAKNELMTMREEYETISYRNDDNISLKNKELRELNDKLTILTQENKVLAAEKGGVTDEIDKLKEEYDVKLQEITLELQNTKDEYNTYKKGKEIDTKKLHDEVASLNAQIEKSNDDKDSEVTRVLAEFETKESIFVATITEKDSLICETEKQLEEIKIEYEETLKKNRIHIEELELNITEKNEENKMLKGKFEFSETERLNAECGLQDLLQQNNGLEKEMMDIKQQLQEARELLNKQRVATLSGGVSASAALTSAAEEATGHDSRRNYDAAASAASAALAKLAGIREISSNEEAIAKSAILAAHNTAQLSTYAMDVSNTSTNTEVSEKLTKDCREMLSKTKQFLEALSAGSVNSETCNQIQNQVAQVLKATAAADTSRVGESNVDDELAEMDRAIEDAAGRIEEMLATSRATDSGLKLEVNNSILDACTTLMAAVKVLVQDSRRLQSELGDPRTRTQLYRKNPQWSEGLISAAKAVVFAAKLLVSSADEAVGSEGRVEGVAAAAHEVAGSTAQLVAASRARAPPAAPALAALTAASRHVAAAAGAVLAAARAASAKAAESGILDTSSLSLTATRRLEMESKVRALELEVALDAERARLAALRKRHYTLAQQEENGNMTNGK